MNNSEPTFILKLLAKPNENGDYVFPNGIPVLESEADNIFEVSIDGSGPCLFYKKLI